MGDDIMIIVCEVTNCRHNKNGLCGRGFAHVNAEARCDFLFPAWGKNNVRPGWNLVIDMEEETNNDIFETTAINSMDNNS